MFYYGFVKLEERVQDPKRPVGSSEPQWGSDLVRPAKDLQGIHWCDERCYRNCRWPHDCSFQLYGRTHATGECLPCIVRSRKNLEAGRSNRFGEAGGYGDHAGALEPTVVELKDGRIWMMIRTNKGQFYQAFSNDHALTWTRANPTGILSPNAPGFVTRLQSGRLAFVWNLIDEPKPPSGSEESSLPRIRGIDWPSRFRETTEGCGRYPS